MLGRPGSNSGRTLRKREQLFRQLLVSPALKRPSKTRGDGRKRDFPSAGLSLGAAQGRGLSFDGELGMQSQ
jgi:hypothetical protein